MGFSEAKKACDREPKPILVVLFATLTLALTALASGGCGDPRSRAATSSGTRGADDSTDPVGGGSAGIDSVGGSVAGGPLPSMGGGPIPPVSPQPALAQPAVSLQGGSAPSAGGRGQDGGSVHLLAQGGIALDSALAIPAAPVVPAAPAGATVATAVALAADLTVDGSLIVAGDLAADGSDAVRQISAGGDIFVEGSLRAADLPEGCQGLTLRAPAGTVYITGVIDTSGAAGGGQDGGPITIVAQRVVVTGQLISAGSDGSYAGDAGPVTITSTQGIYLAGLNATGGDAITPAGARAIGGHGGDVALQAGGDVTLAGPLSLRGGYAHSTTAGATGGDAGTLTIDGAGVVTLAGTLDGRGGIAVVDVAGRPTVGGAAGAIKVGESAPARSIAILVPLLLGGGDGDDAGGSGGSARLEAQAGDLRLANRLDASGGASAGEPGAGGSLFGSPGLVVPGSTTTAGIDVAGPVITNGGSITSGASGDGAAGGVIKLVVLSSDGDITLESTGQLQTDGGEAGGGGHAGGGGLLYLFGNDGNAWLRGRLLARGGNARDAGGTGGQGGFIHVFTDNNHGGTHGSALVIGAGGYLDASGGGGTIGGSARNDGRPGSVASGPGLEDDQYAVPQMAVLIDSDGGSGGPATGYIDNQGLIVARGGQANGAGGDVRYHGQRQDGSQPPIAGNLELSGEGAGPAGDFAGP
jgi:hypothetical protein